MGLLRKIGRFASKAAPLVGMIPGVGTLAAAGLGAGGALIAGEGVKTALRRGALGAAGGVAGGLLRGAGGLAGLGGRFSSLGSGGANVLSRARGILGSAGSAAVNQIRRDPLRALRLGSAGLGMIQGARQAGEARDIRRSALTGLAEPGRPDLGAEFSDPTNPFRAPRGVNAGREAALRSLRY